MEPVRTLLSGARLPGADVATYDPQAAKPDHASAATGSPEVGADQSLESVVGASAYRTLLDDFMAHLPRQLIDLEAASAMGDVAGARYVAHQLKGTSINFGATDLDAVAEHLLLIGSDQHDLLRSTVHEMVEAVGRLQGQHRDNRGATLESKIGSSAYREQLTEFVAQLPHQVIDLEAASAMGDVAGARYVAHQLKGTALSFGATELDALAERILLIDRDQHQLLTSTVEEIKTEVVRLQTAH
jgi:HPt (histidine-containing phosphotransfer) domain-containing protein